MDKRKAHLRRYYRRNKEKYRNYGAERWKRLGTSLAEHRRETNMAYRLKAKQDCFLAYGDICKCCGETEFKFLTIDHVFNDGYLERGRLVRRVCGAVTYVALRKLGYPQDRYQLLCMDCNFGKRMNKGVCPHLTRGTQ
jgi:hypothetical protein